MLKKVFIKKKWHSHLFFKSLLLSDDNLEDYKKKTTKKINHSNLFQSIGRLSQISEYTIVQMKFMNFTLRETKCCLEEFQPDLWEGKQKTNERGTN